jgi:predicted phosphodiesterase
VSPAGEQRFGVLADIHSNLQALEAAIATLRADGARRWLCAGDIVGYGPQPNECIEALAGLDATCVAGNHDLMALGELDGRGSATVRAATSWTRRALGHEGRSWLAALPRVAVLDGVVVAHGSLEDPERYVDAAIAAALQLETLAGRWPDARVLVLGHTHRPMLYRHSGEVARPPLRGGAVGVGSGPALCNPGSVGQSRQPELLPRARCALLDLDRGSVRYHSPSYDVATTRRLLSERGLPRNAVHLVPGRIGAAGRRVAETWRGAARRTRGARSG